MQRYLHFGGKNVLVWRASWSAKQRHGDDEFPLWNNRNDTNSSELAAMTIVSRRGTNGLLWFTASNSDTGLTRR